MPEGVRHGIIAVPKEQTGMAAVAQGAAEEKLVICAAGNVIIVAVIRARTPSDRYGQPYRRMRGITAHLFYVPA